MGYIEDIRKLVGHRPLILVGSIVIIIDQYGRILLQERLFPKGAWGLPGGLMELGESTEENAKREVFEETGLRIRNLKLFNVYSGPDHHITAENGDEFYAVTIAYYTTHYEGQMVVDYRESVQCEFFFPSQIPRNIVKSQRKFLKEFINQFYIGDQFNIQK